MEIFHRRLYGMTAGHKTYEYTVPGTYYFYVPVKTEAFLAIVASGGDRYYSNYMNPQWYAASGGAAFVGRVYLPAGKYTVIVGGIIEGSTSGNHSYLSCSGISGFLIDAEGGKADDSDFLMHFPPSMNAVLEPHDIQVNSARIIQSGNKGGASLYMGYGKGSDANKSNYTTGYFKVEW